MCVYLHTKFQVSSIILTRFKQEGGEGGGILPLGTHLKTNPEKTHQD